MDAHETDAPETLLNLRDAAAALGLRPATVVSADVQVALGRF